MQQKAATGTPLTGLIDDGKDVSDSDFEIEDPFDNINIIMNESYEEGLLHGINSEDVDEPEPTLGEEVQISCDVKVKGTGRGKKSLPPRLVEYSSDSVDSEKSWETSKMCKDSSSTNDDLNEDLSDD